MYHFFHQSRISQFVLQQLGGGKYTKNDLIDKELGNSRPDRQGKAHIPEQYMQIPFCISNVFIIRSSPQCIWTQVSPDVINGALGKFFAATGRGLGRASWWRDVVAIQSSRCLGSFLLIVLMLEISIYQIINHGHLSPRPLHPMIGPSSVACSQVFLDLARFTLPNLGIKMVKEYFEKQNISQK